LKSEVYTNEFLKFVWIHRRRERYHSTIAAAVRAFVSGSPFQFVASAMRPVEIEPPTTGERRS
jgi:hypothetical protein